MPITLRAGVMPGTLDEYTLQDGATSLRDLLNALTARMRERGDAGFDTAGFDIRHNNSPVVPENAHTVQLAQNAMVLLVKKVKGNTAKKVLDRKASALYSAHKKAVAKKKVAAKSTKKPIAKKLVAKTPARKPGCFGCSCSKSK